MLTLVQSHFKPGSKGWRGLCSYPGCELRAEAMQRVRLPGKIRHRAYCRIHATQVEGPNAMSGVAPPEIGRQPREEI